MNQLVGGGPPAIVNEPEQTDVTFLAVHFPFIKEAKRNTFNMDTSDGKPVFA